VVIDKRLIHSFDVMNQKKISLNETERTPLAQLAEAAIHPVIGYQVAQASIVTTQIFEERVGRSGGLHRVEFTILALVQGNPDVSARQLARALAVTPPNIAVWLDRLESRGLVTRQRSASDARVQHIRITRTGAALVDRSVQQVLEGERAALSGLSPAERAMLLELLHKVAMSRRKDA
jgi:DNA-binding MarR family transcriptional regulator